MSAIEIQCLDHSLQGARVSFRRSEDRVSHQGDPLFVKVSDSDLKELGHLPVRLSGDLHASKRVFESTGMSQTPCLSWWLGDREFACELPNPWRKTSQGIRHSMMLFNDELILGAGEKTGLMQRMGQRYRLECSDAMGYNARTSDPLYKHHAVLLVRSSSQAQRVCSPAAQEITEPPVWYALVYENRCEAVFDIGKEISAFRGKYRYYETKGHINHVSFVILAGNSLKEVVKRLYRYSGFPCVPPKWALGYLGSSMLYADHAKPVQMMSSFIDECRKHEVMCSGFHLSSGYCLDGLGCRHVFIWDQHRIPEPRALFEMFHHSGVKVIVNVKPWLLLSHPSYSEVASFGGFLMKVGEPLVGTFWKGGAGCSAAGSYLDFTNPQTSSWWKRQVKLHLLEHGADAVWNDNNEFEVEVEGVECFEGELDLLGPAYLCLKMAEASYEAQAEFRPDMRPFVISRSAVTGIQSWVAQTWSGDNATSWETLKRQTTELVCRWNTPMGLSLSLCGLPFNGHDVGGFAGAKPTAELFLRWIQNGVFQPRFSIHSWNSDGSVTEPWMYPEVLSEVQRWMKFREELLPFLYSLHLEAFLEGTPPIRPLIMEFEESQDNLLTPYVESFAYMVGESLLVSPIMEPIYERKTPSPDLLRGESVSLELCFPGNSLWLDIFSGQVYDGGQKAIWTGGYGDYPVFLREDKAVLLKSRLLVFTDHWNKLADLAIKWFDDDGVSRKYLDQEIMLFSLKDDEILAFWMHSRGERSEKIDVEPKCSAFQPPETVVVDLRSPSGMQQIRELPVIVC